MFRDGEDDEVVKILKMLASALILSMHLLLVLSVMNCYCFRVIILVPY